MHEVKILLGFSGGPEIIGTSGKPDKITLPYD